VLNVGDTTSQFRIISYKNTYWGVAKGAEGFETTRDTENSKTTVNSDKTNSISEQSLIFC